MSSDLMPVLWIWGAPGVGKTTVGWQVWTELSAAGFTAGYVDIDQLGMSLPASTADPERYGLKVDNLAAVLPHYRSAGADLLVVSGACDVEHIQKFADGARVTLCRLQLDHEALRARLAGRGWDSDTVDAAINEAIDFDASTLADITIDTAGLSVAEVVTALRGQVRGWPRTEPAVAPIGRPDPAGDIVWLCGPTGVGKSAVGWDLFIRAYQDGRRVALIDLQQIGFLEPSGRGDPGNHLLKARNLAAMWATMRADDADCLIVVGTVDDREQFRVYTDALPTATLTLIQLHAGCDQLAERIVRRGHGEGPQIPGDQLCGRDAETLARIADRAAADADRLAQTGIADMVVDTDGMTVEEVADVIRRQISN
jgi:cytidylate kinase